MEFLWSWNSTWQSYISGLSAAPLVYSGLHFNVFTNIRTANSMVGASLSDAVELPSGASLQKCTKILSGVFLFHSICCNSFFMSHTFYFIMNYLRTGKKQITSGRAKKYTKEEKNTDSTDENSLELSKHLVVSPIYLLND